MDNTAVFYTVNVGSIPARRTKFKHIVLDCDLVHQKSKETEAVCFNLVLLKNRLTLNGVGAIIIA